MQGKVTAAARLAARGPGFVARSVRERGLKGGLDRVREVASWRATAGLSRWWVENADNPGTPVWERDWDVLLILDACRTDLMREVAHEYEFVGSAENVGTHWSVASKSDDWLRRTFAPEFAEETERTAYVTGNPFTAKIDRPVEPARLDEVWRYAWDDDLRTIPARPITDRAVETWRTREELGVDRMIVHYMQPHSPFVSRPELGEYGTPDDFGEGFGVLWGRLREDLSIDEAWAAYRDNLRYVLDDVELLLENTDADRVAITADHGNGVGEFGVYGHPSDVLIPSVRRVPWVETVARDAGEYVPGTERAVADEGESDAGDEVADRLRALGYAE